MALPQRPQPLPMDKKVEMINKLSRFHRPFRQPKNARALSLIIERQNQDISDLFSQIGRLKREKQALEEAVQLLEIQAKMLQGLIEDRCEIQDLLFQEENLVQAIGINRVSPAAIRGDLVANEKAIMRELNDTRVAIEKMDELFPV